MPCVHRTTSQVSDGFQFYFSFSKYQIFFSSVVLFAHAFIEIHLFWKFAISKRRDRSEKSAGLLPDFENYKKMVKWIFKKL